MKIYANFLYSIFAVSLLASLAGCVDLAKYEDAPRSDIHFESLKAATTFYDAVLDEHFTIPRKSDGTADKKSITIYIGENLVTWKTEKSSNVIFNEAAAIADANHDGTITENEADAFAANIHANNKAPTQPASDQPAGKS